LPSPTLPVFLCSGPKPVSKNQLAAHKRIVHEISPRRGVTFLDVTLQPKYCKGEREVKGRPGGVPEASLRRPGGTGLEFLGLPCYYVKRDHLDGLVRMKLSRKEFEETVVSALKGLPVPLKKKMKNIDVVVEDEALPDLLSEMGLRSPLDLFGLYQGIPLDQRGYFYGNVLPDKITLYQRAIESASRTEEEVKERIQETVIHEVGHYFGLSDEQLRELEHEGRKRRKQSLR
jgi:predicted Zn-dependent protease with MMP-like domain